MAHVRSPFHSLFHRPLHVALLGGGTSAEREVSLASAAAVEQALVSAGHAVEAVDPADADLVSLDWARFDVAFLALHGTQGEDGTVQRILENAGIPFTGSDAEASELAFHKSAAKRRFAECGVPTPAAALLHEEDTAARIRLQVERVGFPLVVKPDAQGSSLGVGIVRSPEDLPRALAHCFRYGETGLVETFVEGTEWTVAVLDDVVLPLVRIDSPRGFYDYEAKYLADDTAYTVEFDLPDSTLAAIREAGRAACLAVGTSGIARADVRLDDRGRPWVLEVNTLPGMTDHSLVPKAAARAGISFVELCERSIASGLAGRAIRPGTRRERPAA